MTGLQLDIEQVENRSVPRTEPEEDSRNSQVPQNGARRVQKCCHRGRSDRLRAERDAGTRPLLRRFIEKYRESNDPVDLVAAGSAIRTFIAIASRDDAFDFAASLLKAGSRLPLAIELEIEVSKMVVRKLTANPPAERNQYAELAMRLEELVDDYARPRFLAREKHGAMLLTPSWRRCSPEAVEIQRSSRGCWPSVSPGSSSSSDAAARLRSDLMPGPMPSSPTLPVSWDN